MIWQLYEATPLQKQPQFSLKVRKGTQNEELILSLPEARKLAQTSTFVETQWERGHERREDFCFTLPNDTNFAIFQKVIHMALGRPVDIHTPLPPKHLSLLFCAVDYLEIKDVFPVISPFVTADHLHGYLNANSLEPGEIRVIQQSPQQSLSTQSEEVQQKWHNLATCRDIYVHMALHAKSDVDFQSALSVIVLINHHPGAINLFNDRSIYNMLLSFGNAATSYSQRGRVVPFIQALIKDNPAAGNLFATLAVRDMLINMAKQAPHSGELKNIANVIVCLNMDSIDINVINVIEQQIIHHRNQMHFDGARQAIANLICIIAMIHQKIAPILLIRPSATQCPIIMTEAYGILIDVGNLPTSEPIRAALARAISNIAYSNLAELTVFTIAATRDMLIKIGNEATSDEAREWIARAIIDITFYNSEGQAVFSNDVTRDRLIHMGNAVTSDSAREWIASVIFNIADNNLDMLIHMGNAASSDGAREWIARAIVNMTSYNLEWRTAFSKDGIRDMLINMGNVATSDGAREWIARAIVNITSNNPAGRAVFANTAARDMLANMCSRAIFPDVAELIANTSAYLFPKRKFDLLSNESNESNKKARHGY